MFFGCVWYRVMLDLNGLNTAGVKTALENSHEKMLNACFCSG